MSGIDRARWVALFGEFSEKALKLASSWWAAEIRIILVKLLVENHFFKNRHFRKFSKKSVFFCRRRFVVDIRRPKPVIMPIPHDRPSHATKTRGFENVGEPLLWFKISLVHLAFYPNWCIFRSLFGSTFGSFLGQFLVQYLFIFCSKKVLLFIDFRRFLWSYVYDKIPPIFLKTDFVQDREFCRRHTTKTCAWAPPSLIQCFQPKGQQCWISIGRSRHALPLKNHDCHGWDHLVRCVRTKMLRSSRMPWPRPSCRATWGPMVNSVIRCFPLHLLQQS